jgi:F-box associated region.
MIQTLEYFLLMALIICLYQVSHVFQNYGPGVRFIKFYHGGMDTQFWAGHYGSKMSGACVKLMIPLPASRRTSIAEDRSDPEEYAL